MAGVAAGVYAVFWCCVVCRAWCDVFEGLREGRHVMPVAAGIKFGMVGLLYIVQP